MRKYLYKNIECFRSWGRGTWCADYVGDGKRFALHRMCVATKETAYEIAKLDVDYLNRKEN